MKSAPTPDNPAPNPPPQSASSGVPQVGTNPGSRAAPATGAQARRHVWRQKTTLATRRWARDTFSRDSMISSLKSLAWVAPLTVLIWIYAEREQLDKSNVQFIVDVKSADPSRVVTLLGADGQPLPDGEPVAADLSGPKARLEDLREKLDPRSGGTPVELNVDKSMPLGRQQIDVTPAGNDPRFKGITLANPQPRFLNVQIDSLGTREVAVEAPPGVATLAGAEFSPAKVHVSGPESLLAAAERDGKLVAYAEIASMKEAKEPGHHDVIGVRVTVPLRSKQLSITPAEVSGSLDVKPPVTGHIRTLPIFVVAPPTLLDQYKVIVRPETLANVQITGPIDQIEQLERSETVAGVKAVLEVSRSDAATPGPKRRQLTFDLPKGVAAQPTESQKTIEFELIDRKEGAEIPDR